MEITSLILAKRDEDVAGLPPQEGFLVDKILDVAGSKGTGMMTVKEAAERGVAAPTIAAALFERYLSDAKDLRMRAAWLMPGPAFDWSGVDKQQLVADLRDALFCSKLVAYAQGLQLIQTASQQFKWGIDLGECARIWKGGCIIRAKILDRIKQAFAKDDLPHLLLDPGFAQELATRQTAWRRVVGLAGGRGVSIPAAHLQSGVLRLLPVAAPAHEPAAGAARLLRLAHLRARGPAARKGLPLQVDQRACVVVS